MTRGKKALPYLVFLISAMVLFTASGCSKEQKIEPPPPDVEVSSVIQKDVPIYSEFVGTADGFVNATIRAQVQGYLVKQNYKEGDLVKKGQVLFEIDPRTFEAALQYAKGQLAAQQARWDTAKANLKRIRPLAEQNAVSQKDLDDAVGTELAAQAAVLAAKAAVDKAALDLEFTRITSLIDGIAGVAKAQIGNLVGPGATEELTTISTVHPIKVSIQASEREYMMAVEMNKDKSQRRPLDLILSDGSVFPHKGEFAFADRQVDVRTGTIRFTALFPNPNNLLRPGQFAKIRVLMDTKKGALLVPQRAITEMQGKYLVAVVGTDNKVSIRPVKTAEKMGSDWIIEEGLNAGDRIVAEGIQKVKEGITVNPKPFVPAAEKKQEAPPKTEAPHKQEKR